MRWQIAAAPGVELGWFEVAGVECDEAMSPGRIWDADDGAQPARRAREGRGRADRMEEKEVAG